MTEKSSKTYFKRIITILFGLSFLGSTSFGIIKMLQTPTPQAQETPPREANQTTNVQQNNIQALKEKEKGYELVLAREPNNRFALQGLIETRLQMDDLAGAVEPLEKLITLYPDNEELKLLLNTIQLQLEQDNEKQDNEEQEQEKDK